MLKSIASICLETSHARDSDIRDAASDLKRVVGERETSIFLEDDFSLAMTLGLDGVHLSGGPRMVRFAREATSGALSVGAFCGCSIHQAMNAGEAGADYVSFGPVSLGEGRPDRHAIEPGLFERWREITVVPVVAVGCLAPEDAGRFGNSTDFLSIGGEIWSSADPIREILAIIGGLQNASG